MGNSAMIEIGSMGMDVAICVRLKLAGIVLKTIVKNL